MSKPPSEDPLTSSRAIKFTREQNDWLKTKHNASRLLRRLVDEEMAYEHLNDLRECSYGHDDREAKGD